MSDQQQPDPWATVGRFHVRPHPDDSTLVEHYQPEAGQPDGFYMWASDVDAARAEEARLQREMLASEYLAATGNPIYGGTRDYWKARAEAAEARLPKCEVMDYATWAKDRNKPITRDLEILALTESHAEELQAERNIVAELRAQLAAVQEKRDETREWEHW